MKKIIIVIALLICGSLITFIEISSIKRAHHVEQISVVVLKHPVEGGQILTEKDLMLKSVDQSIGSDQYTMALDQVMGLSLIASMPAGTLINKALLTEKVYHRPDTGKAMTSIRLSPEEALCWEITIGEALELVHISEEQDLNYIGMAVVKGLYNQQLTINDKQDHVPIYLLVEGSKKTVENLVTARGRGRIEVIKLN